MLVSLATVAALAAPVSALAAPAGRQLSANPAAKRIPLAAKVETCTTAGARSATFRGQMPTIRAIASGGRMEMRFDLYERGPGATRWTRLPVESFGEWALSETGVSAFIVRKRVSGLQPGVSYRAAVRYRWRNAAGKVVRTARRLSAPCRQSGRRANLVVRNPRASAGPQPGLVTYTVTVRNVGGAGASVFSVVLNVGGVDQPAQRIGPLGPGRSAEVSFQAPRCPPDSTLRVTADAGGEVPETNERDNVLERRCAAPR